MFQATIPGGTAMLRTADELIVKHRRVLRGLVLELGLRRLADILSLETTAMDEITTEVGLTPEEKILIESLTDVAVWAMLDSWSLGPIPETPTGVHALPAPLRDALATATAPEAAQALVAAMRLSPVQ